jgi:hypothetical protein
MRQLRQLTKKQRQRLVAGAKIRKQTKAWILKKLNNGETYGRGTHFFHASKGDIHEARQPSRYHGNHEAKRV